MPHAPTETPRKLFRRQRGYLESLWRQIHGLEPFCAPQEKTEYDRDGEEVTALLWQLF